MTPVASVTVQFAATKPGVTMHSVLAQPLLQKGQSLIALQAELQKLDPLLAALAAVPWIDPNAEDGQRVPFIKSTVLDQVEGMGKQFAYANIL